MKKIMILTALFAASAPAQAAHRTLQCDLTITASKAEGKEPSQQNVGQTTQIVEFIGSGYAVMHTVSGINPWNMNQVPVTMGDSLYVLHTARSDANGTTTDITIDRRTGRYLFEMHGKGGSNSIELRAEGNCKPTTITPKL